MNELYPFMVTDYHAQKYGQNEVPKVRCNYDDEMTMMMMRFRQKELGCD